MNDQQPQYFEVDTDAQASVSTPWWKTWKIAALIGGLLVAAAIAVFVVNTVTVQTKDGTRENALSALDQALAACRDARDPVQCANRARAGAAQEGAGEKACDGISDDGRVSCLSLAARQEGSTAACASLGGEDRTQCENLAWFTAATTDVNLELCEKISERRLASSCSVRVTAAAVAAGNCSAAHVDESFCTAGALMRDTIALGTDAACATLGTEALEEECKEGIMSRDNDGDGLVVYEEAKAGTSDENADTDGDGYSDSMEIENGFNPIE